MGKDIEYIVLEDKKVIVCKLWNCRYIASKRIRKHMNLGCMDDDRYAINDVYVGMARCDEEDCFDIEYGKKLALKRAKIKRGEAINNAIKKYIKGTRSNLMKLESKGIHSLPGYYKEKEE